MCYANSYLKCNIFKGRSNIKVEIPGFSYLIPTAQAFHFNNFQSNTIVKSWQKVTSTWGLSLFNDFSSNLIARKRINCCL